MERKIGEKFQHEGVWLEVAIAAWPCHGVATECYFYQFEDRLCPVGLCVIDGSDEIGVVFIEVEAEPHHGFIEHEEPVEKKQKHRDNLISERQRLLSKIWAEGWLLDKEKVRRDEIEAELDRMENEDLEVDRPGLSDNYCSHCEKQGTDCECDDEGVGFAAIREPSNFERIASEIGKLTFEKNCAYGNSFVMSGEFLKLLYPDGLKPDQYGDALLLVRIFDKQMRIANNAGAFGESPYRDLVGYGLLGASLKEDD